MLDDYTSCKFLTRLYLISYQFVQLQFLADHTARTMIDYWHGTVVWLSVYLHIYVTLCIVCG